MSKVCRVVRLVPKDLIADSKSLELERLYGKFKDGDILVVFRTTKLYMWPNLEKPLYSIDVSDRNRIDITLCDTQLHENAVEFFEPLKKIVWEKKGRFNLHLRPTDGGLAKLLGRINLDWKLISVSFSPKETTFNATLSEFDRLYHYQFLYSKYTNVLDFWNDHYEKVNEPHLSLLLTINREDKDTFSDTITHITVQKGKYRTDCFRLFLPLWINIDNLHYEAESEKTLAMLTVAVEDSEKLLLELVKKGVGFKLLLKSEIDTYWDEKETNEDYGDRWFVSTKKTPRIISRKQLRHKTLVDICLAFSYTDSPYSVYDVVNCLPWFKHTNRFINIEIIENVFNSIRRVWARREEHANKLKTF